MLQKLVFHIGKAVVGNEGGLTDELSPHLSGGTKENHKNLSHDSQWSGQDSNCRTSPV